MTNGRAGQHLWPARLVSATLAGIATRGLHETGWSITAKFPQASDFSVEFEPPLRPAISAIPLSRTDRRADAWTAQSATNPGTRPALQRRGWASPRPPRTRNRGDGAGRVWSPEEQRTNVLRRFVVRQALRAARGGLWLALVLAAQLNTATAFAGPFTRLQVLLPGETAASGTPSGKTGTPSPQTAGVPFFITVNACDASWALVPSVTHSIQILASDASASLPAPAQLVAGTGAFLVILNAGGNFTIYAHDLSDVTIPDGASSLVRSIVLQSLEFSNIAKHETAGAPFSITITARDPNGVLVSGFTGAVRLRELTSFGEGRITPSTVTLTAGQWTGNVTAFRADATNINSGNVNLRAEVQAHPSQSGASNSFIVHPGPFRRVQIVTPGESPLPGSVSGIAGVPASQSAGRSFTVSVYGTDDYWNQVLVADAVQVASSTDPADTPVSGNLSGGFRQ